MRAFFASWRGRLLTGVILALTGLLDLSVGSTGLGIGLVVVGALIVVQGFARRRSAGSP
jgi:uncharacterized membrane protein HdeD (DUF308 family)